MLRQSDTATAEPEVKVIDFGLAKAIARMPEEKRT